MIGRNRSCLRVWNWPTMVCVWILSERFSRFSRMRLLRPGAARLVVAQVLISACAAIAPLQAADSGASVVVVYNSKMPESKQVAEYYAERRHVPSNQVFGFDLPVTESMTRIEFIDQLQKPLL